MARTINSAGQRKRSLKLQREKRSESPKSKQEIRWVKGLGRKEAGEKGGKKEREGGTDKERERKFFGIKQG